MHNTTEEKETIVIRIDATNYTSETKINSDDELILPKINRFINDVVSYLLLDRGFKLISYITVYLNDKICYSGLYDIENYEMNYTVSIEKDKEFMYVKKRITENVLKKLNELI